MFRRKPAILNPSIRPPPVARHLRRLRRLRCRATGHHGCRSTGQDDCRALDAVSVDLTRYVTADGIDYRTISPRGYVPLLQFDDGSRHTEAAALLQHVADLDPQQRLIGAPGSARRLAVVEWLTFVSTELHKVFSPWLWHKETAESTQQAVKEKLATRFAELDALLGTQQALAGEYSVADAYAFTIINWSNFLGLPLAKYPNLVAYMARVSSRPAAQDALRAEGLLK